MSMELKAILALMLFIFVLGLVGEEDVKYQEMRAQGKSYVYNK